jgi:valyl-tRNA synthetase
MAVMHYVFSTSLRLLHPVMPFLTEELWHEMGYGGPDDFIMKAPWPKPADSATMAAWGVDAAVTGYVAGKHDLIRAGRALKADFGIPAPKEADYVIRPDSAATAAALENDRSSVKALLKAGRVDVAAADGGAATMPGSLCALGAVFLSLDGVDIGAELEKLGDRLDKARQDLERVDAKLGNETFTSRAPEHVVARQRELRAEAGERLAKLERQVAALNRVGAGSRPQG